MKSINIAAFTITTMLSTISSALTYYEQEYVCPIGNETFSTMVMGSSTTFGYRLDLKPMGPVAAPSPLAVCPSNGFVIYKAETDFSDEEIANLTKFVLSKEYQELRANNTDYYLLAKIFEHQKKSNDYIAYAYLRASWQAEGSDNYKKYLDLAIQSYYKVIRDLVRDKDTYASSKKEFITFELLIVELKRLMGNFKDAKNNLTEVEIMLMDDKLFDHFKGTIELENQLIKAKDSKPR
jgi:hypothetical protein